MARAKNMIIAGSFEGAYVITSFGTITVAQGFKNVLEINKDTVNKYEVITEETQKSGASAILRGAIGIAALGGIGILAGLTAKNKGIHTIAIEWKDSELQPSLLEIDDKVYKTLIKVLF